MADSAAIREAFEELSRAIGYVVLIETQSDSDTEIHQSGVLEGVQLNEVSLILTILGVEHSFSSSDGSVRVSVRLDNGQYFDSVPPVRFKEIFSGF